MRRAMISPKNRSTRFSHDALVGVKGRLKRGCLSNQALTLGRLVGGIVIQHQMHRPSALNRAVDMAQELQERFGWVARHAIATDKPGLHVKHRGDRRSVVAHIIISHGLRATLLDRQAGLDPDKRLNLRFPIDAKHHCPL